MKKPLKLLGFIFQKVINFFVDCWGFIHSLWVLWFNNTDKPWLFYGFRSLNFSEKYAMKRYRNYPVNFDRLGKQQLVIPYGEKLLVCSRLEFKFFQKRGYFNKKKNYTKLIKFAKDIYFTTPKS